MNLEDIVCSLELAIKLKELKVNQDSLFYHVQGIWNETGDVVDKIVTDKYTVDKMSETKRIEGMSTNNYSAFTLSELAEMLPDFFSSYKDDNKYYMAWNDKKWKLLGKFKSGEDKASDAMAKMLIHLLENQLIERV